MYIENCDTKEKCELVGNCWNNNTGVCSTRGLNASCPTPVNPDPGQSLSFNSQVFEGVTSAEMADGSSETF